MAITRRIPSEVEGNWQNSAVVYVVFMEYHYFQNKGLFLRDNFVFEKSFFN
jgi:hypothetical protein